MSTNLLLFGASGRSGQLLQSHAEALGWRVMAPSHAECPLEQAERVSDCVLQSGADVVINAAAVSSLERCMEDALQTHLVNAVAPAAMALACRHTGARFLHLSTDYVLDGRRAGLKAENAHCKPLSVYAESKREAEFAIAEAYPESLIARVSWICGNKDKPAFVEQVVHSAQQGKALAAVADKYSLPTDAADIARVLAELAARDIRGVLHLCSGGEPLSWRDCAAIALDEAARLGLLPAAPSVEMQRLKEVPFFREPRPQHTAMSNERLLSLGLSMPTAESCIRTVIRRMAETEES